MYMTKLATAFTASWASITACQAADAIRLKPGQQVTVVVSASESRSIIAKAPPISTFDQNSADAMNGRVEFSGKNYGLGGNHPEGRPEGGLIKGRFYALNGGRTSMLIIENGTDRSWTYKARISHNSEVAPTGVCQLPPHFRGYEQWSYAIEWIEISDIEIVPYQDGEPLRCE